MARTFRKLLIQDKKNKIYHVNYYELSSGNLKCDYVKLPKHLVDSNQKNNVSKIVDELFIKDHGRYAKDNYYHKKMNKTYRLKSKQKLQQSLSKFDLDDGDYDLSQKHLKLPKLHVQNGEPFSVAFLDKY